MYKVCLVVSLLLYSFTSHAQCDCPSKKNEKFRLGFNLGMNLSNIYVQSLPNQAYIDAGPGFRLGIMAEWLISKRLSLTPRGELSFNRPTVYFPTSTSGGNSPYQVMPHSIELAPMIKYRLSKDKFMPYLVLGPNIKIPVRHNQIDQNTYSTGTDVALDAGIGVEKQFGTVFSALELKYSLGLLNINKHPQLQRVKLHNISLIWTFLG